MADNLLFDVDASKIIAKLHLAAKKGSALRDGANDFIVNTGIVNDSDASPEDPGKTRFDIKNPSGTYQIGYITSVKYYKPYNTDEKNANMQELFSKLEELKSKLTGKDSSIKASEKDTEKDRKEFEAAMKTLRDAIKAKNNKDIPDDATLLNKDDEFKKLKAEVDDLSKNTAKADKSDETAAMDDAKENAAKSLMQYMNIFAGKSNITNDITKQTISYMQVSDQVKKNSPKNLVEQFQFQEISDKERGQLESKFKATFREAAEKGDKKVKNVDMRMCFYANFTLTVDK